MDNFYFTPECTPVLNMYVLVLVYSHPVPTTTSSADAHRTFLNFEKLHLQTIRNRHVFIFGQSQSRCPLAQHFVRASTCFR